MRWQRAVSDSMPVKRLRPAIVLLLAAILTTACDSNESRSLRFYALGTVIEVTLRDVADARAAELEKQLIAKFQHWQTHWHPWDKSGKHNLATVNDALAQNGQATIDTELEALLRAARPYYEQSAGLFDPAIGSLVRLWGFNQDKLPSTAPDRQQLDKWLAARPDYNDVMVHDGTVISNNPGVQLDFGGFAKGYALEQAAAFLREQNIGHALINAGGDLTVLGDAGGRPWRIGIRHPRNSGVLATVELGNGESLISSGDYERYFTVDDKRYHHILDPRTARPADNAVAVSVLDDDAARADAAATALFVAGAAAWRETAAAMHIDCVMLIDAQGGIHMTDCMRQRLQFRIDPQAGIEVTP